MAPWTSSSNYGSPGGGGAYPRVLGWEAKRDARGGEGDEGDEY
uniref:Uncharacterized protein n=1 Tax=Arundo donax TaxID=35708 RepID=A0A0A9G784_ARUDO